MTDESGAKATAPDQRPRWTDRGRERVRQAAPHLLAILRTGWARLLPLLQRLWAAADGDVPAPPPPDDVVEFREVARPISVAAKGHIFTFTVRAGLTWSATGLRPEALTWYARYFMPAVIQRLRRVAADRARELAPHQAGDLEVALQTALGDEGPWRYAHDGVAVECRPEVWVSHDERVRRALRPYWDRLIELDCQYELYLKRARYAEQLNRRWVAIMEEFVDDPAGGEQARAVTEELARARRHMAAEQRAAAQWSAELMRDRQRQARIFEPFTAIDIVPKQAPGPAKDAPGRPTETTSAEGAPPASGPEDRR
ncbi:hypothetical protein [Micromonospora sp. SL4-19]|uniref:hypothetical protein n=1 Tax=Micromonospora sp. SL4-19 TaxID=3399129 RepID=UPI003A4D79A4